MRTPLSGLRAAALASVLAWLGAAPTAAAPRLVSDMPRVQPGVIPGVTPGVTSGVTLVNDVGVQPDSARIIRRDRLHRDGAWKKKRRHLRDKHHHPDRDDNGHNQSHQHKGTQKFAYDQYGNVIILDGDGRDRDWQDDGGRDWRNKKRRRPRIYKMHSQGVQQPSPGLKGVLTTVPD